MFVSAIIWQLILLAYHQTTTLVDLFPFNGARNTTVKEKLAESISNLVLMSLAPIGFIFGILPLIVFGTVYYIVLFGIEFATWWIPYFAGGSKMWCETWDRVHSRTWIVLPKRGNNPIPNVEHLILMGLTLMACYMTDTTYAVYVGPIGGNMRVAAIVTLIAMTGTAYQFSWGKRSRKGQA